MSDRRVSGGAALEQHTGLQSLFAAGGFCGGLEQHIFHIDLLTATIVTMSAVVKDFFFLCCLGRSRAERPSVSEFKVKITTRWPSHHNQCNCTANTLTRTCKNQENSETPVQGEGREVPVAIMRSSGKAEARVFRYIPWTGDRR